MAPGALENYLRYLGIVLHLVLLARLLQLGLAARYRAVTVCLAGQALRSILLLFVDPRTDAYFELYFPSEIVLICCRAWVVVELYQQVLERYQNLSILSSRLLSGIVGAGLVASVAAHLREFDFTHEAFEAVRALHLVETTVYTALLLFLLILGAFVLWYPVPLKKNLILYSFGYSVYFMAMALGVYLRNLNPTEWTRLASTGRILVADCCLLVWLALVRRAWEDSGDGGDSAVHSLNQERILAQLDALNDALQARRRAS